MVSGATQTEDGHEGPIEASSREELHGSPSRSSAPSSQSGSRPRRGSRRTIPRSPSPTSSPSTPAASPTSPRASSSRCSRRSPASPWSCSTSRARAARRPGRSSTRWRATATPSWARTCPTSCCSRWPRMWGYTTDDVNTVYFFQYTPDANRGARRQPVPDAGGPRDLRRGEPRHGDVLGLGHQLGQPRRAGRSSTTSRARPRPTSRSPGTSPAITAVLGDQVMAGFSYSTAAINQGDALRVLAIASEERVPSFPDVPTFKELDYDMVGGAYRGVAVPSSTPEEVRQQLSDALGQVNADPEFIRKMEEGGFVVIGRALRRGAGLHGGAAPGVSGDRGAHGHRDQLSRSRRHLRPPSGLRWTSSPTSPRR